MTWEMRVYWTCTRPQLSLFAWPGVWWCPAHTTSLWFNGVASSVVQSWSAASPTERGAQIRMFRRKQEYFHLTLFFKCVWRQTLSVLEELFLRESAALQSTWSLSSFQPVPAGAVCSIHIWFCFPEYSLWREGVMSTSSGYRPECISPEALCASSKWHPWGGLGWRTVLSLSKSHAEPQDHCHRGWGRHKFNSNGRKAQHSPDVPVLWKSKIKNKKKNPRNVLEVECIKSNELEVFVQLSLLWHWSHSAVHDKLPATPDR